MLIDNLEALANSLEAIEEQANDVVIDSTKQMIKELTSDYENAEDYYNSFDVSFNTSGYFIIRFNPETDDVESEEKGKQPFSIKDLMLRSGMPGVKISKEGYLYRTVPLQKSLLSKAASADRSVNEQKIQETIRNAIASVNFQVKSAMQLGDRFVVQEKAMSNDGLLRVKSYASEEDYRLKRIPKMNFIAFRSMSTNPNSKSDWINPGWKGGNIQQKAQVWLQANSDKIKTEVITELINTYLTGASV
jgi:hypothetical protein